MLHKDLVGQVAHHPLSISADINADAEEPLRDRLNRNPHLF